MPRVSNHRNNHKPQERAIVDNFRNHYPEFPQGVLIDFESPDFVLKRKKGARVGIELTSIKPIEGNGTTGRIVQSLADIIEKKNEKSILYRKHRFVELWLIIAIDYLDWPQSEPAHEFLSRHGISTHFRKVFLYDLFHSQVYELN